jgi:hypothetical protein
MFHHKIGGPCRITMMPKFWRLAAQSSVAGIVLIALTVVCYRLHLNLDYTQNPLNACNGLISSVDLLVVA